MLNSQSTPAIDEDALALLIEMIGPDEPEAILDLLDTYLDDSTRQIESLKEAFAAGDMKNVHRIAHSMKSSSATFGALVLSSYCEKLEQSARDNCASGDCERQIAAVTNEHTRVVAALQNERTRFLK